MKKSKFQQLIRGMVSDLLEGKGTAPGSPSGHSGMGSPGAISKGGFTLQDFNKVLGGYGGGRSKSKDAGGAGARSSVRTTKASLFKGGRSVDQWRLDALKGGESIAASKYQTSKSKSKDVSANISSLAAIRKTDNDFRKQGGGRKTDVQGAQMKVSAAYISQKASALTSYGNLMETEQMRIKKQIEEIENDGGSGTIEWQVLHNLNEDINLRSQEYSARWDFATAAYNSDQSAMDAARHIIEMSVHKRKNRIKTVDTSKGHYSSKAKAMPWQERGNYKFGDTVTDRHGTVYTATAGKGWTEKELGKANPEEGHPMWRK